MGQGDPGTRILDVDRLPRYATVLDMPAIASGIGPDVNQPIGLTDDGQVVFDDDQRVTRSDQLVEQLE